MKRVIIVQARMTSTRLPGKVMKTVLNKPLLEYLVERLRRVKLADDFVIATTDDDTSRPIVEFCKQNSVSFMRGPEEDVLERYYLAAAAFKADVIARITSDCPLVDPQIVDDTIHYYLDRKDNVDYIANWKYDKKSNTVTHTYPLGMSVEVFTMSALQEARQSATARQDREHVTPFFYTHPVRFRTGHCENNQDLSSYRWTVDTPEDFELVRRILEHLYPVKPEFTLADILSLVNLHPDWSELNRHIEQTKLNNIEIAESKWTK